MAGTEATADLGRDGWTVVRRHFSPAECDTIAASSARRSWPSITRDLLDRVHDPRWAALVLGALGPDVCAYREQPLSKDPRSDATVPWHQDHAYAPGQPSPLLTCLLALEHTDERNGCLWVEPGSHLGGPVPHSPAGAIAGVTGARPGGGVPVPLGPGDVLVLDSLTWHRSGPNTTESRRSMWLVQYCGADALRNGDGSIPPNHPMVASDGAWIARVHH